MAYSLNMNSTKVYTVPPAMPSIPQWVVDAIPKGIFCNIRFCDGVWSVNGKVVNPPSKHKIGRQHILQEVK